VLALLREKGTLDELGIGQIRDSFADALFPGFSTIQTRAKYFVTVPQIFADYWTLDSRARAKLKLEDYLKKSEDDLAARLSENHSKEELFPTGIIGHTLVGKGGASNRPSSAYWTGLRNFGLIDTRLSLSEFCRTTGKQDAVARLLESDDQNEDDDLHKQRRSVCNVPGADADWLKSVRIDMTRAEAEFLRDKIRYSERIKDSIPAQLIDADLLDNEELTEAEDFAVLSERLQHEKGISQHSRDIARKARRFSIAMEGAHIRFNYLIASKLQQDSRVTLLSEEFAAWRDGADALRIFHPDASGEWTGVSNEQGTRLSGNTIRFLHDWNIAMVDKRPPEQLDIYVQKQALANKGNRSLLKRSLGQKTDWRGMRDLQYRWPQVRQILRDIKKGLAC
jgi:hypothetical protein